MRSFLFNKSFGLFVIKFILLFCLFYFGSLAIIGISAPGGWYSSFVSGYLDFISAIKLSLLYSTKWILAMFGIKTQMEPNYLIRFVNGRGVYVAQDCVGFGVYSFWAAYVIATWGSVKRKVIWIVCGLFGLWLINVIRITLFLTAINKDWPMPLGIDHHTWFNIFAYLLIFTMMFFYDKKSKIGPQQASD